LVNASLNWASIVGIVLAVSGAGLYFLRSFKPALARDYDVFFAAIGLLCGGILFFQGWRLDPILQFGQFLLAGTTVFFAYESVRLRGVATDQARRSSYFEDEFESPSMPPRGGFRGSDEDDFDQFDQAEPIRRRFSSSPRGDYETSEDDFYRSRRTTRPAIPEQAASRRSRTQRESLNQDSVQTRRMARFRNSDESIDKKSDFGDRRTRRQDQRRGSRPRPSNQTDEARRERGFNRFDRTKENQKDINSSSRRYREPTGAPIKASAEDAAYSDSSSSNKRGGSPSSRSRNPRSQSSSPSSSRSTRDFSDSNSMGNRRSPSPKSARPRDNSSRFDD